VPVEAVPLRDWDDCHLSLLVDPLSGFGVTDHVEPESRVICVAVPVRVYVFD
jgi:hypothetical protein